jgi:hypothetical protein
MTRGIAEIHGTLMAAQDAIERLATQRRAETTTPEDLVWAALTLARDSATCTSILADRPVLTRNLDQQQLRHALRGAQPPAADAYTEITKEMLHAILEAGPLRDTWPDIPPHLRPVTTREEEPPPDNVIPITRQAPNFKPPRLWPPR